jgi:hypothetical protein
MPRSLTARPAPRGAPDLSPDRPVESVSETSRMVMASANGAVESSTNGTQKTGPILISIADARTMTGLSRSVIYRQLAAGNLRAVKGGARTLILLQSLIDYVNSLPSATFGGRNAV